MGEGFGVGYNFHFLTIFFFLCFFLENTAKAQQDSTLLPEISIEASPIAPLDLGFKSQSFDSATLARMAQLSLSELLTRQTPIFLKFYGVGGLATPAFRGTGAGHTQVFWNDIPIASPMLGQVDFSLFPIALTDKVRIDYGGASLQSGEGGFGGAIHLQNQIQNPLSSEEKDSENAFLKQILLLQSVGSFQTYKTHFLSQIGTKRWQSLTRLFFKRAENDFPFRFAGTKRRQQNAALVQGGLLQELYFFINAREQIALRLWWQKSDRELPPPLTVSRNAEFQQDQALRLNFSYERQNLNSKILFHSAFLQDKLLYQNKISNVVSESRTQTWVGKVSWQAQPKGVLRSLFPFQSLFLENSLQVKHDQAQTTSYKERASQTQYNFFTNIEWQPQDFWGIKFLLRQTFWQTNQNRSLIDSTLQNNPSPSQNEYAPLLPVLGLNFNLSAQMILKANMSRNFRFPTLNDRFWFPVGNPNLRPEKGWQQELSLIWRNSSTSKNNKEKWQVEFETTFFRAKIEDWILWSPAIAGYWRPENLRRVRALGVESNVRFSKKWTKDAHLELFLTQSYTETINRSALNASDASFGKQLIYVPLWSQKSTLSLYHKKSNYILETQYFSRRFTTSSNSQFLPYYWLFNLGYQQEWRFGFFSGSKKQSLFLQVRIDNVLNFQYQSIALYPMAGRQLELSLRWALK
ncbi:TonB-dependent receptor [Hugenholtzia roseola]|uniref:TonB-dependent receptor n=1 Tax=Hugenholtzia roseola TaxID=1002 RepID=UPI001377E4B1|nr:TonB-dependent receptor [Hugenholtzia roseola]